MEGQYNLILENNTFPITITSKKLIIKERILTKQQNSTLILKEDCNE